MTTIASRRLSRNINDKDTKKSDKDKKKSDKDKKKSDKDKKKSGKGTKKSDKDTKKSDKKTKSDKDTKKSDKNTKSDKDTKKRDRDTHKSHGGGCPFYKNTGLSIGSITCPVMAALVKNKHLVPTLAGEVTKAQTVAALRAVGISEGIFAITSNSNFDHLPEPKVLNLFKMNVIGGGDPVGAVEHFRSTGIRDAKKPDWASLRSCEGLKNDIAQALGMVRNLIGPVTIAAMLQDFGTPQGTDAVLSSEEMEGLWMHCDYPAGFAARLPRNQGMRV
eukprot:gene26679-biopygen3962